jgi:hypothetical protein
MGRQRRGTLFYRNAGKTMVVDIETGARFRAGTPKMLFDKPGMYDVSRDGKRFLMAKQGGAQQGPPPEMHVVLNWFEELLRRAPAKLSSGKPQVGSSETAGGVAGLFP